MVRSRLTWFWFTLGLSVMWPPGAQLVQGQSPPKLPAPWHQAWENPGPAHRPLQIVHGIRLQGLQTEGVDQMVAG